MYQKIRAVIIDDEVAAIGTLEAILKDYCTEVDIVGTTSMPTEAGKLLIEKDPDVVFLDINMPGLDGFELLSQIKNRKFEVIFVTAYDDYAIKAFKECALDYILKPVEIERVVEAVRRINIKKTPAYDSDTRIKELFHELSNKANRKISLATSEGVFLVPVNDIVKIIASQSYSEVFIEGNKKLLVSKNIGEIENIINDESFFRVHKSFLVNMNYITRYSLKNGGEVELKDGSLVLLSRRKKDEFVDAICKHQNSR